jgi:serine/threonine-protein kinase
MVMSNEEKEVNWSNFINNFFPGGVPETKLWTGASVIAEQLNNIGYAKSRAFNHTFMPGGGGLDLTSAQISTLEPGCIEINFDSIKHVVKPSKLYFHSFYSDPQWFYFRLETDNLKPSGVYKNSAGLDFEEVCRLPEGELIDRSYYDYGYYRSDESGREIRLPSGSEVVIRQFGGSFVIFGKFSAYNQNSSTYDGRHNKMTNDEFRSHIQSVIDYLKSKSAK